MKSRLSSIVFIVFLSSAFCSIASAQSNWTWRNPAPQGDPMWDMVWTGSQFVATGVGGVATSPDGVTWTPHSLGSGNATYSIAWTRGLLVAVGFNDSTDAGIILTSPDGVTWTSRAVPVATGVLDCVAWTGTQLVALGDDPTGSYGIALTSPDGVTWTSHTLSGATSANLFSLTWTGNQLVAVGSSAALTSPDGVTWTAHTSGDLAGAGQLYYVAWDGEQLAAVGQGTNQILTSPDGITWTARATGVSALLASVTWTGTQWVAVAVNDTTYAGLAITSPDGITWTRHAAGSDELFTVKSGGGKIIAGGQVGEFLSSTDGANWTPRSTIATTQTLYSAVWNGAQFLAVGDGNSLLTSPDGIAWTPRVTPDGVEFPTSYSATAGAGALLSATWAGPSTGSGTGLFVAVGQNGEIVTSPDGITWTDHSPNVYDITSYRFTSVTWTGSQIIAVGYSDVNYASIIVTSPDGVNWTNRFQALGNVGFMTSVTWTGTQAVALGYDYELDTAGDEGYALLTSPDGATWTAHATALAGWPLSVTWANGQYVALGQIDSGAGNLLQTSPDGVNWTTRISNPTTYYDGFGRSDPLNSVIWTGPSTIAGGGEFIAAGSHGTLLTSPDGATWTQRATGTLNPLQALAWNGSQLVAVGEFGTILTSALATTAISPALLPRLQNRVFLRVTPTQLLAVLPNSLIGSNVTASIYTMTGDKVLETPVGSKNSFTLPIGKLAHGKYLLEVKSPNGRAAQTFNVQR